MLHLFPAPFPAQSAFAPHILQAPVDVLHVGRFGSTLQSLFIAQAAQAPVPRHLGAVALLASQAAFEAQAVQALAVQMGMVEVEHCDEAVHSTQPVPIKHCGFPAISKQSVLVTHPTQLLLALHSDAVADVQSALLRHCTHPVPALHSGLPEIKVQSALLMHTAQELLLHLEALAVVQSVFVRHCLQASDTQYGLGAEHCMLFTHCTHM